MLEADDPSVEYACCGAMEMQQGEFVSKPKTKAQLDRATDLRLRKTYNITLKDYEYLSQLKNGGCWICGSVPSNRRLHVDHDHSWKKVPLQFISPKESETGVWFAKAVYNGEEYVEIDPKKSLATRGLKKQLLRASVRGLLCYQHNAGLQKFSDKTEWLLSSARYLGNFHVESPLIGREVS